MERLINSENIYANIKNLLEKESDALHIENQMIFYHYALKTSEDNNIKQRKPEALQRAIATYSKIGFYLLTKLTNFEYKKEVWLSGFNLAAYCFEVIARNGDLDDAEIEESKLLSAICYTLGNNAANSIVMAKSIDAKDELMEIYKLFLERKFNKIRKMQFSDVQLVQRSLRNMAIALIYKCSFEEELEEMNAVLHLLKNRESEQVYLYRLMFHCAKAMCDNSVRNLISYYPELSGYIDVLTKTTNVYELWESQKNVIVKFEEMRDVTKTSYISMPTSAGKTLLGELILYNYLSNSNGLALYIVPSLALEDELRRKFLVRFKKIGIRVSNGIEYDDDGELICPQIVVATPEKVDMFLRKNRELYGAIKCIIFDEFHKVSVGSRGWFEEALLIWINSLQVKYSYKIVLISAIADNMGESLNSNRTTIFEEKWAPTRKLFCKFELSPKTRIIYGANSVKADEVIEQTYDLVIRYPHDKTPRISNVFSQMTYGWRGRNGKDTTRSDTKADVCWKAVGVIKERPLMVFFFTKQELKWFIQRSSVYMSLCNETLGLSNSVSQILGEEHLLVECLRYGVAFHDGDLPSDVRSIIEKAFRKGVIKVLACTTTLADGVNLPAKAILMANIFSKIYDSTDIDLRNLDLGDYKNIVGRIGRALYDTEGTVYLIKYPEFYKHDNLFGSYYAGAEIKSPLVSVMDALDIDAFEDSEDEQDKYKLQAYKQTNRILLQLQLLIFTIYEEYGAVDFDNFMQLFVSSQILNITEKKKRVFNTYGRKYFELAKNVDAAFLNQNIRTGVSLETNIMLREIANQIVDSDNWYDIFTEEIYTSLLSCVEFKPDANDVNHYTAFLRWIDGDNTQSLFELFPDNKHEETTKYIKNVFQYIGPWMLSCLSEYLNDKSMAKQVVDKMRNQIRYGSQDDAVISLCRKGIKSRDLAIAISNIYHELDDEEDIIKWLLSVSDSVLYSRLAERFEITLLEQIGFLRMEHQSKSSYFEKVNRIKCRVTIEKQTDGIGELVEEMKIHNIYMRRVQNPFNEYCVGLYIGVERRIGVLPQVISEEICELLELEENLECTFCEEIDGAIWVYISKENICV